MPLLMPKRPVDWIKWNGWLSNTLVSRPSSLNDIQSTKAENSFDREEIKKNVHFIESPKFP